MKQAWIIGTIMLYVILMGLQMFVTDTAATASTGIGSELYDYRFPQEVTSYKNPESGGSSAEISAATIATSIWTVGQMAMLRFPALFSGQYVWFWYCVCLPIAISFWVVMFTIFRGVGSS